MAKKLLSFKTKGMNKDLSVSAFNPEFSFENMNLRLSTNEGNTLMSWVNEKGTKLLNLDIENPWNESGEHDTVIGGSPIGMAIINHTLVLFTTMHPFNYYDEDDSNPDFIYTLKYSNSLKDTIEGKLLYNGNLNFNSNYPLETLVSYEAELILKVYWTDGYNQPRVINIAANDNKLTKWNSTKDGSIDTFFDFVPAFKGEEKVSIIQHSTSGGIFAPGVIQYAFTYINKYGQQSNIVYISPLYYLSLSDRGASPEEKVTSSFEILIRDVDKNFDYIRLYSILRTSLDLEPIVKLLEDIPVTGTTNSELYSASIVYNNNLNLTLPVDANGKIYTKKAINGSYTVYVTAKAGTHAYPASSDFKFEGYSDRGGEVQEGHLFTLLDLLNRIYLSDDLNVKNLGFIKDYHAGFYINLAFVTWLTREAVAYDHWMFYIGDILLFNDETVANYLGCSFVYNYFDNNWYVTNTQVVETVNKEEKIGGPFISYIDNGTTGSLVDPTEMLYIGGRDITALTMEQKDGTLFLGNIKLLNSLVTQILDYFDSVRETEDSLDITFHQDGVKKHVILDHSTGYYTNTHLLKNNLREISTFKGGEKYRFGFLLLKNTGEWSEPIFISDERNLLYPTTSIYKDYIDLTYAKTEIDAALLPSISGLGDEFFSVYKKIRPVIVFPTIGDRTVLCLGVLNPTVFNALDRKSNSPFALASWYFRPYMAGSNPSSSLGVSASYILDYVSASVPELRTGTPDTSIDAFFSSSGLVKKVYVLVAEVPPESIDRILLDKNLKYRRREVINYLHPSLDNNDINYDEEEEQSFFGAVRIMESNKFVMYAFISDMKWPDPNDALWNLNWHYDDLMDAYLERRISYSEGLRNVKTNKLSYDFANPMLATYDGLAYYNKESFAGNAPSSYTFKFCTCDNYEGNLVYFYTVTFDTVSAATSYVPNANNTGTAIPYTHYSSLVTTDIENVDLHEIEILGAIKLYDTVFDNIETLGSNTLFFIDQSIVTLNSPDIEFDTEVLVYGVEGLKLRVIGVIPITANISAHSIDHSPMLETKDYHVFGKGEIDTNVLHNNIDIYAGKRLVADYLWNDVKVVRSNNSPEDNPVYEGQNIYNYMIYPWHRTGSLNNDFRQKVDAVSWLNTKKESNLLYSINSEYLPSSVDFTYIGVLMMLTENNEVMNIRLPRQKSTTSEVNYYANIDKVLYNNYTLGNNTGYLIISSGGGTTYATSPISIKYKSTSHAVIDLRSIDDEYIPILPSGNGVGSYTNPENHGSANTFWGDTGMLFLLEDVDLSQLYVLGDSNYTYNFLWLGEIYKEAVSPFGGTSKEAVLSNKWLPAGEDIILKPDLNITLYWTDGDTYYQRYDCMKTYPFTDEDTNLLTEILSFMCETHINIDGRYDRNRGLARSYLIRPEKFNLMNYVYSLKNNFFTSRQLDMEDIDELSYPNAIYYSKTKEEGADVDLWTNVTLATVLSLDGDKGLINKLVRFNDLLISFLDTGISQILYNENVQISSTAGVPIEIANSGKVQGKRYISDTIGCSNKWSVCQTPSGIYFMDNYSKGIYLFNRLLQDISTAAGFNSWCKLNIPDPSATWSPRNFNNFISYYDKINLDILFINKDIALAYSEKLGVFTSFYNYGEVPYFCNLDDTGVFAVFENKTVPYGTGRPRRARTLSLSTLWLHQTGEYCNFFGNLYPYWITLVGNPEPLVDKTFTNLEFRASVDTEGTTNTAFTPYLPFDNLEVWNEYQHGITDLENKHGHSAMVHHSSDMTSALKRKFRIWRCDIPRDNYPLSGNEDVDVEKGIYRYSRKPMDRIRNPWAYLKLLKENNTNKRVEIHDVTMTYFS